MGSSSLPTERVQIRHAGFAALCVIVSAGLSVYISGQGGWTLAKRSLIFFSVGIGLTLMVAVILRVSEARPQWRRRLALLGILVLASALAFSRISTTYFLFDPQWIGGSYLIFRLIQVLIDGKRLGNPPAQSLVAYAIFPPALIAGPINRANDFLPQLDNPHRPASERDFVQCVKRIGIGLFKAAGLGNAFSLIALTPDNGLNPATPRLFLWLFLVGYAFMLYFNFAGYSDIAIGVAGLVGIRLPENFANPYAQSDLGRFWQSWHISLSSWVRDYIYFPFSRQLMRRVGKSYAIPIMVTSNLVTMVVIGLWHGVSTGFLVWGLWHGVGLSVNGVWASVRRSRGWQLPRVLGICLTFTFVLLGWIFFAMPDAQKGFAILARMFGR